MLAFAAQVPIFTPASRKAVKSQVTATSTGGSIARGETLGGSLRGTADWMGTREEMPTGARASARRNGQGGTDVGTETNIQVERKRGK